MDATSIVIAMDDWAAAPTEVREAAFLGLLGRRGSPRPGSPADDPSLIGGLNVRAEYSQDSIHAASALCRRLWTRFDGTDAGPEFLQAALALEAALRAD